MGNAQSNLRSNDDLNRYARERTQSEDAEYSKRTAVLVEELARKLPAVSDEERVIEAAGLVPDEVTVENTSSSSSGSLSEQAAPEFDDEKKDDETGQCLIEPIEENGQCFHDRPASPQSPTSQGSSDFVSAQGDHEEDDESIDIVHTDSDLEIEVEASPRRSQPRIVGDEHDDEQVPSMPELDKIAQTSATEASTEPTSLDAEEEPRARAACDESLWEAESDDDAPDDEVLDSLSTPAAKACQADEVGESSSTMENDSPQIESLSHVLTPSTPEEDEDGEYTVIDERVLIRTHRGHVDKIESPTVRVRKKKLEQAQAPPPPKQPKTPNRLALPQPVPVSVESSHGGAPPVLPNLSRNRIQSSESAMLQGADECVSDEEYVRQIALSPRCEATSVVVDGDMDTSGEQSNDEFVRHDYAESDHSSSSSDQPEVDEMPKHARPAQSPAESDVWPATPTEDHIDREVEGPEDEDSEHDDLPEPVEAMSATIPNAAHESSSHLDEEPTFHEADVFDNLDSVISEIDSNASEPSMNESIALDKSLTSDVAPDEHEQAPNAREETNPEALRSSKDTGDEEHAENTVPEDMAALAAADKPTNAGGLTSDHAHSEPSKKAMESPALTADEDSAPLDDIQSSVEPFSVEVQGVHTLANDAGTEEAALAIGKASGAECSAHATNIETVGEVDVVDATIGARLAKIDKVQDGPDDSEREARSPAASSPSAVELSLKAAPEIYSQFPQHGNDLSPDTTILRSPEVVSASTTESPQADIPSTSTPSTAAAFETPARPPVPIDTAAAQDTPQSAPAAPSAPKFRTPLNRRPDTEPRRLADLIRKDVWSRDPSVVQAALQSLAKHSSLDDSNHSTIARTGGLLAVVRAMEMNLEHAGIQIAACECLEKLALDPENELAIGDVGGIEAILGAMMNHFDDPLVQEAAWAALWNLTCGNADNQLTVDMAGGIEELVQCMMRHCDHANVQKNACGTLANLCLDHEERMTALAEAGGFVAISTALQKHWKNPDVRKEASYALTILLGPDAESYDVALHSPKHSSDS